MDKQTLVRACRTRKLVRYAFYFIVLVAVFALIGFFALPPVVKSVVASQASKALQRPVSIDKVRINPFAMTLDVDGLSIREREGEDVFLGFDQLHADVDAASLFKGGLVLSAFRLANPQVRVVRLEDGRFNFSDLLDAFAGEPETDDASGMKFSLNNIQVSDGSLVFDDRLVRERHEARDINLSLPFISNMDYALQTFVEPAFSALINDAVLRAQGKSRPFAESQDSELSFELADVKLPGYMVYAPAALPVHLASGTLDTAFKVNFHNDKEKKAALQVSGTATLRHLDLRAVDSSTLPALENLKTPPARLAAEGLDTAFNVDFHNKEDKAALQVSGSASLKNFDIRANDGSVLSTFKNLDIALGTSDVSAQRFVVDRVALDMPKVDIHIDREGKLSLLAPQPAAPAQKGVARQVTQKSQQPDKTKRRVATGQARAVDGKQPAAVGKSTTREVPATVMASETAASDAGAAGVPQRENRGTKPAAVMPDAAKPETAGANVPSVAQAKISPRKISTKTKPAGASAGAPTASPVWSVGELAITNGTVRLLDESRGTPVNALVDAFDLNLKQLTSQGTAPADLKASFKFNDQGDVILDGQVEPFKPAADLKLAVKSLDLLPLQPYFGDKLNVELKRGRLTADGVLQLWQTGIRESSALEGKFTGQATLGNIRAVDKADAEDFLRWKSLYFGKIDVDLRPLSVVVGEIALSDFFARVVVSEEGRLNLFRIVRRDEAAEAAQTRPTETGSAGKAETDAEGKATALVEPKSEGQAMPPVRIDKITLQGGNVRFTDNFVKPNYTANLRKIGGNITHLSSAPGTVANLELRGSYDDIAPLTVGARINPLSAKPYLDLQAEVKGVELTSLSTYAAKYAGYAIEKGKLSLTVNYKIEDDQLQAQNRVFIDQLTFGENRVDSPEATSLPVKLAVSLLQNRAGEIDLDLPISGTLSDPEFSIGSVVVKMIVNLLTKAVTAPFALLGSLSSGGEEMSTVEFDPGRARISEVAEKRLESLVKALVDRPSLKLEITAIVDPDADKEGLKRASIDRKVRAMKREQTMTDDGPEESGSTVRVEVSPEEYPALLERVYRAEKFPKPRNVIGLTKSLPVEEMEKLMLAHASVTDEDLRDLGDRRARRVRDWLVEHQMPADRIFLLPTKMVEAGDRSEDDKDKKAGNSRVDFSLK